MDFEKARGFLVPTIEVGTYVYILNHAGSRLSTLSCYQVVSRSRAEQNGQWHYSVEFEDGSVGTYTRAHLEPLDLTTTIGIERFLSERDDSAG